ncbi:protein PFC0760c-like [Zerene cesonia]|uniref:protein PFC0760c-like n=1 Tax=Zerene cesonia TaxID=33412 RepID=UPI0018E56375|nr:protein PFC0760c-like [Zerene cesonia]
MADYRSNTEPAHDSAFIHLPFFEKLRVRLDFLITTPGTGLQEIGHWKCCKMQLIFDTETEACIVKKMAFIDKESINEKFAADNIVEKLSNSISNGSGNKENIGKVDNIVVDNYTENNGIDSPKKSEVNGQNELSVSEEISTPVVDTASSQTAESESIENITDKRKDEECIENASDIDNTIEQSNNIDDVNIHTDNDLKNNLEHEDLSNGNVLEIQAGENICSEEKHEKNTIIGENDTLNPADCSQMDSDDHKTEINPESDVNTVENQDEILESSSKKNEEINVEDTLKSDQGDGNIISFLFYKTKTDTIATENGLNTSNSNKEVMISNDEKTFSEKEHAETESQVTSSKDTEANSEKMDIDLIKEGDSEMSNELKDDHEDMKECENPVEIENPNDAESNRSSNIPTLQEEKTEKEKPCNRVETESKPESHLEKQNEPKKIYTKSKLSLDILSDDEDTVSSSDIKLEKTIEPNKQCINIEDDDDDIMLIDDENSTKPENEMGVTKIVNEHNEAIIESKDGNILEDKKEESSNNTPTNDQDIPLNESKIDVKKLDSDIIDKEENKEKISSPKPLLSTNFVSTCKKNLAEMTRSDLEEFCVNVREKQKENQQLYCDHVK